MTPSERDNARLAASNQLDDATCVCVQCLLARAVLAFVPAGDVQLPEGYRVDAVAQSAPPGMTNKLGPVLVRADAARDLSTTWLRDAATMRALGLALVAQADALSPQGEAGKGGR